jgi:chromosome segregation ATPase
MTKKQQKSFIVVFSLNTRERRIRELFEKIGRSAQFKTTKERDAWLKKEIKQADGEIVERKEGVSTLETEIGQYTTQITTNTKSITEKKGALDQRTKELEQDSREMGNLQLRRDDLNNRRKYVFSFFLVLYFIFFFVKGIFGNNHKKLKNV